MAGEARVNVLELNLALDREYPPMTDRPERSLLQRDILLPRDSVVAGASSTRASVVRNPVMFVVEVGAVLTTLIWLVQLFGGDGGRTGRGDPAGSPSSSRSCSG